MTQHRIALRAGADLDGFRRAVRVLIAEDARPEDVVWTSGGSDDLFGGAANASAPAISLPRTMGELIGLVVCHRDPERYALLYAAIHRMLHGERALLEIASDPLVHRLERMGKAIRRDLHKMHAFLRFRRIAAPDGSERFVAWFEPDHFIVETAADFLVERFRNLVFSILTPIGSLHWDRETLTLGPPARRADAPDHDPFETGWSEYYRSTFNPARVNPVAMRAEMPRKYWRNMPETATIPNLIRTAGVRVRTMMDQESAEPRRRDPAKAIAAMPRQSP